MAAGGGGGSGGGHECSWCKKTVTGRASHTESPWSSAGAQNGGKDKEMEHMHLRTGFEPMKDIDSKGRR